MPEDVKHWSGEEPLTCNAASLAGHDVKSAFRRKDFTGLPVAHLGALACSPFARKGLGARLITFQRAVALAYGHESRFLALEAMKPLDETYYPKHKFQRTTQAFYRMSSTASLVPMFSRLTEADAMPAPLQTALEGLQRPAEPYVTYEKREASRADLWAADAPESLTIVDGQGTLTGIVTFLWYQRDDKRAAEILRQIVVRASLSPEESAKLWAMRYYALAYGKPVLPLRSEAPAPLATWSGQEAAVKLTRDDKSAIADAWKSAVKTV